MALRRTFARCCADGATSARVVLDRDARKALRADVALKNSGVASREAVVTGSYWAAMGLATLGFGGGAYLLMADPESNSLARKTQKSAAGAWLLANVGEMASPFVNPSRDKLLPDWPPEYLNISRDVPCPHTLVVDFDETLVCATWDRRHGWRHAKRPGADLFLREMSKYYEIVIFTSQVAQVGDVLIHSLDKENCAMHRLYRDATKFVGGHHCKDLSRLNRDPRKIVVIDDNPLEMSLQPGNAVFVTPYKDASDRTDTELEDLIPFLAALVNEGVKDVPHVISKFSANDAKTVAREYNDKLNASKQKSESVRSLGLGGFVRSGAVPLKPASGPMFGEKGISAKDIVGEAPPPEAAKKGWLWRSYASKAKEAEEQHKLKMEAWQKVLQKKDLERRRAQEQEGN
ncbi:HAD-like domain-containing protein [Pelagophyceae sp. CCMP2097]|nr:HAD-like domain-containing protein [Pelagophyceae sp. CCMP2097]